MKKERKESKNLLWAFFAREKMATARGIFAYIRTQAMNSSVCRPNAGFAAQDQSSKCRFPRSAIQTSPYDVRKTTKLSTTCMYYLVSRFQRKCRICNFVWKSEEGRSRKTTKKKWHGKGRSELLNLATNIYQYGRWPKQHWAGQLVHNLRKARERCKSEMNVQIERVGKVKKS